KLFLPDSIQVVVGQVVVARKVKEGHLELVRVALEFAPFADDLWGIFAVPFDEIADGNDELGLQQIQLFHGLGKYTGPMATGAIADDGKLERGGFVIQPRSALRRLLVLLQIRIGEQSALARKCRGRGQEHDRDENQQGPSHGSLPE